jgi:hypothetical protein
MMKLRHSYMLFLSGLLWMVIGCFLLPLGLNFIVEALLKENGENYYPILRFLSSYVGGFETAALCWIGISLGAGILKGRTVFAKNVRRTSARIQSLPNPAPITKMYTSKYYLLLASMFLIGFLFKFAPLDVRGGVDIAIGCGLIQGALLFFRQAWTIRDQAILKT